MTQARRWQRFLPEPFWPTLFALLMLSTITAAVLFVPFALIWPNVRGTAATLIGVGCYVVAIPLTWLLFRKKRGR